MKRLIVHGDPGIRKDAVIEYDGEELTCFGINRNGEWHGPEQVQLWCTVGDESEREDFETRNFVPHFLEVIRADAGEIEVLSEKSPLSV